MTKRHLCLVVAALFGLLSGPVPAYAQAATDPSLIASPASPPRTGLVGSERGRLLIRVPNRADQPLIAYSNGAREGYTDSSSPNQCTHLIVRYAELLGLADIRSTRDVGDGKDVANNFAAGSGGRFRYIDGAAGTEAPLAGAVVSIGNRSSDGGAWANNPYGHVGIAQRVEAVAPDRIMVTLFDQNFPLPSGRWKQVTFTRANGRWSGLMFNATARGTQQLVVAGWANPVRTVAPAAADTSTPDASARAFVASVYTRYRNSRYVWTRQIDATFSPLLSAALHADARQSARTGNSILDYDPLCQCQDADGLQADIVGSRADGPNRVWMVVRLSSSAGSDVELEVVRSNRGWRINDVRTRDEPSLLRLLTASTRTPPRRTASRPPARLLTHFDAVALSDVNVRGEANINGPIVGRLRRGQRVTIEAVWRDWCFRRDLDSGYWYIACRYLSPPPGGWVAGITLREGDPTYQGD